jgi:hypothetical protein
LRQQGVVQSQGRTGWLYVLNRRRPGILNDTEADLERVPELQEEVFEVFEHAHPHPHPQSDERILA